MFCYCLKCKNYKTKNIKNKQNKKLKKKLKKTKLFCLNVTKYLGDLESRKNLTLEPFLWLWSDCHYSRFQIPRLLMEIEFYRPNPNVFYLQYKSMLRMVRIKFMKKSPFFVFHIINQWIFFGNIHNMVNETSMTRKYNTKCWCRLSQCDCFSEVWGTF